MAKTRRTARKAKGGSTRRRSSARRVRNYSRSYSARPQRRVRRRTAKPRGAGRDRNITITLVQQPAGGVNDALGQFAANHSPQKPETPKRARF